MEKRSLWLEAEDMGWQINAFGARLSSVVKIQFDNCRKIMKVALPYMGLEGTEQWVIFSAVSQMIGEVCLEYRMSSGVYEPSICHSNCCDFDEHNKILQIYHMVFLIICPWLWLLSFLVTVEFEYKGPLGITPCPNCTNLLQLEKSSNPRLVYSPCN